jgi:hypothetical protein
MAHLKEAATALQTALEENPREREPLTWAEIQTKRGEALMMLGTSLYERGKGLERLGKGLGRSQQEVGIARLEEALEATKTATEPRVV